MHDVNAHPVSTLDFKLVTYYTSHSREGGNRSQHREVPPSRSMRRPYLDVVNPRHRKALTRVLLSNHKMAVEIWQYAKTPVPPEHRCARSPSLIAARLDFQKSLAVQCMGEEIAAMTFLDGDICLYGGNYFR
ncbi:hypothetical protein NMY22_g496 [Coprinellus aureogranulatus]|nr:hypothetical protein NMY22_g496 [Coprinellus aureogranulatus]